MGIKTQLMITDVGSVILFKLCVCVSADGGSLRSLKEVRGS